MRCIKGLILTPALCIAMSLAMVGMAGAAPAASSTGVAAVHRLESLKALLNAPDAELDLAKAKLMIDQLIDPTINDSLALQQLDHLAADIRARFPPGANDAVKMELLLDSVYRSGPWNDYRPFSYDLDDPFGKTIANKLLPTYLRTRKGNCVSMPTLLVVLGQKLGLDLRLATAPEHILAKFHNPVDGQWVNVEATSGGFKLDSSYQRESGITPLAMKNGIYLRPLSRRESVAVMMGTLMEYYSQHGQQNRRIELADLALKVNPKDVTAMLQKGNAYFRMMDRRLTASTAVSADAPMVLRPDQEALLRNNLLWFEKAEALGWKMPSQADTKSYRQTIQRARATQQGGK